MPQPQAPPDALVIFVDDRGTEYPVALYRLGHGDKAVRSVAYRIACKYVLEGTWDPQGELHYRSIGRPL